MFRWSTMIRLIHFQSLECSRKSNDLYNFTDVIAFFFCVCLLMIHYCLTIIGSNCVFSDFHSGVAELFKKSELLWRKKCVTIKRKSFVFFYRVRFVVLSYICIFANSQRSFHFWSNKPSMWTLFSHYLRKPYRNR